jgi:hypothetical protein
MRQHSPVEGIIVYDNVIHHHKQAILYNYCINSNFTISGWHDTESFKKEDFLHSNWLWGDLEASEILEDSDIKTIMEENGFHQDNFNRSVLNLDTMADSHSPHTHPKGEWGLLIYVNTEWELSWGGETLFLDRDNEIVYGSKFTPNRVLVFDANIPHLVKQQTRVADKFRMTLGIFFQK